LLILENLHEITIWRDGLDDPHRRRMNHPNAVWHTWRRTTKAEPPKRQHVVKGSKTYIRPIHWSGEAIRRAASAMRENWCADTFVLASVALKAAVRNEADVFELMSGEPGIEPAPCRSIAKGLLRSLTA
jgi:hypothetical protein